MVSPDTQFDNQWFEDLNAGVREHTQGFKDRSREALGSLMSRFSDVKILGKPAPEFLAGAVAGGLVKNGLKGALFMAGFQGWAVAIGAGAAGGAVMGGGKEWFKQARENWKAGLSPEATTTKAKILERLKQSAPSDWKKVGIAAAKGAAFGAVGGLVGAAAVEAFFGGAEDVAASDGTSPDNPVSEPRGPAAMPEPAGPAEPTPTPEPTAGPGVPSPDQPSNVPGDTGGLAGEQGPSSGSPVDDEGAVKGTPINNPEGPGDTGDAPSADMSNFISHDITIPEGGTFWGSFEVSSDVLGDNWTNSLNGVTKEDVVKDLVVKFAAANGHDLNMVHPGDTFQVQQLLTSDQLDVVKKAMATKDAGDYWNNVRPLAQVLMKK